MRTYTPKASEIERAWHVIDAEGQVLGKFEATGIRPRFLDQAMAHGVPVIAVPTSGRKKNITIDRGN